MYYCEILRINVEAQFLWISWVPLTHKPTYKMNYLFIIHQSEPMILRHVQPNHPLKILTIHKNWPHFNDIHSNSIPYQWNIHTWLWGNQCRLTFRDSYGPRLNNPRSRSFNWNKISLSYCYHIIIYHKVHNSFRMKQRCRKEGNLTCRCHLHQFDEKYPYKIFFF